MTSDLAGLETGPEEKKLGLKGSSTVPLLLKSLHVPASHVIGTRGGGFKVAVEVLNTGRTSLGAGCLGGCKAMMREAALHAVGRRQFGTRIADFELIRSKFARMVVNTYALESLVYLTSGLVDRGLSDYALEGAAARSSAPRPSGASSTRLSRSRGATGSWRSIRTSARCGTPA